MSYVGRFAPSPSGPLHAGSLVAALASWLDARAHGGRWLVRIEDVDGPRTMAGAEAAILAQLQALGLVPDAPPRRQSERGAIYQAVLDRLVAAGHAYPCACTRRQIESAVLAAGGSIARGDETVYPGTCRAGLAPGQAARAWRLRVGGAAAVVVHWHDRRLGAQSQDVTREVGDFVVKRADGPWAYQLAVVVDDAAQGITDVVRGEDLADNTARQIHLQSLLGLPTPRYLHTPLVRDARGDKLSKSNGALPVDATADPQRALRDAARVLDLDIPPQPTRERWLDAAIAAWRTRWSTP
ncbi:MAG TPA: tRNA glutamyl-Q(34) synthetase GluQRS [Burkholderiaceae bacterium]|nr:tRNA glutamyl-Q(34) synthetase GluQRS [Burkholderiaceae bacterium]